MNATWVRNAGLAGSGAAFAVAGHFAGLEDFILSAAAFAILALMLGVARDRLTVELSKVERLTEQVQDLMAKQPPLGLPVEAHTLNHTRPIPPPQPHIPALPPGARIASINQRPGIIFGDGTVIVHTLAGYRQFPSEADALFFFGAYPATKLNS